jgi:prolycopene isomerase
MIDVVEAATPLTNIRYTKNPAGAIVGYELTPENAFLKRIQNRTPVKGLYLAGAWGNPGGGYGFSMIGGRNTFRMVMEDWGKKT